VAATKVVAMNSKRIIPLSAATVAFALGAVPAWTSAASAATVQQAQSANWSGYVIGSGSGGSSNGSGQQFSAVSGSWVQPTAKCTSAGGDSAFWVGLGGADQSTSDAGFDDGSDGSGVGQSGTGAGQSAAGGAATSQSDSLEQAGTEADCSSSGTTRYFAWYELVPAAPVKLGLAVHPGDHITTRVSIAGDNMTVAMSDQTTGQSTTKTVATHNPDTSTAEWIAEAPSECDGSGSCQPLALADFGTMSFTGASATTASGHTGTISDSDWSAAAVQLNPEAVSSGFGGAQFTSAGGTGGATPSSLSSDGSSFSVAYSSSGAQPTTTGSGGDGSTDPYGDGSGGAGDPGYGYGSGGGYGYGSGGYGYGSGGYGGGSGGYGYGYGSGGWGDGQVYVY
jgi:hypothetical protein